jgi:hypothetical protein
VRFWSEIVEQADGGLSDLRFIKELNNQRKIDVESQDVVCADLAARAEAGYAAENGDPLHSVPILQKGEDLLHQRVASEGLRGARRRSRHSSEPPLLEDGE